MLLIKGGGDLASSRLECRTVGSGIISKRIGYEIINRRKNGGRKYGISEKISIHRKSLRQNINDSVADGSLAEETATI